MNRIPLSTLCAVSAAVFSMTAANAGVPNLLGGEPVTLTRTAAPAAPAVVAKAAAQEPKAEKTEKSIKAEKTEKAGKEPRSKRKHSAKSSVPQPVAMAATVDEAAVLPVKSVPVLNAVKAWQARAPLQPVSENGVIRYPYGEGTPLITCAPLRVCAIELQPGESVEGVMLGDVIRWKYSVQERGEGANAQVIVGIKPTEAGLRTNGVLSTNRRVYALELQSTEADYTPRTGFFYPDDFAITFKKKAPAEAQPDKSASETPAAKDTSFQLPSFDSLDFDYDISGPQELRPIRVMTDGTRTFFEMPAAMSTLPLLTVRSVDGDDAIVNYSSVYGKNGSLFWVVAKVVKAAEITTGQGFGRQTVKVRRIENTRSQPRTAHGF